MNDSSKLCLSCGLCCDGTLIGFVHLDSEELPKVKKVMDIKEVSGHGFFLHPCDKYCDGCGIYADRPKACASFSCGLLKSREQKELSFNSAAETIGLVKQKKKDIQKMLAKLQLELQSDSFYFNMVELKKILEKLKLESALTQNHQILKSYLKQLDALLIEKFDISLD